jgi:hypothetical protein
MQNPSAANKKKKEKRKNLDLVISFLAGSVARVVRTPA